MYNLWRRAKNERPVIEVIVFSCDHEFLAFASVPQLRIGSRQKIQIEQMLSLMTTTSQPGTKIWRKVRVNKKFHLLRRTSRCAAWRAAYSRHASISAFSR